MVVTRKRKTENVSLDKVANPTAQKVPTKDRKDLNHQETLSLAKPTTSINRKEKTNSLYTPVNNFKENARASKSKSSFKEETVSISYDCTPTSTSNHPVELVFPNTSGTVNQRKKDGTSTSKSNTNKKQRGCATNLQSETSKHTGTKKQKGCKPNTEKKYLPKKQSFSQLNCVKNTGILKLPSEHNANTSCHDSEDELTSSNSKSDESSQNFEALSIVKLENCEVKTTSETCRSECASKVNNQKRPLKRPAASKQENAGPSKKTTVSKIKETNHKNSTTVPVAFCPLDVKQTSKDGSSSESEWEDVAEAEQEMDVDDYNPDIPKDGVQITIEDPFLQKKRKKHQFDFAAYARRQINRFKKDVQLSLHKVHLLCFIASGIFLNNILNRELIRAVALSLLPPDLKIPKKANLSHLSKFIDWYREEFSCVSTLQTGNENYQLLEAELLCVAETRKALTIQNYCLLFVIMGRILGLDVRLCIAVNPIPFKVKNLLTKKRKIECVDITGDNSGSNEEMDGQCTKRKIAKSQKTDAPNKEIKEQKRKSKPKKKILHGKSNSKGSTNKEQNLLKSVKQPKNKVQKNLPDGEELSTSRSRPRRSSSKVSYKDDAGTGDDISDKSDDNFDPTNVSDQSDDDNFNPKNISDHSDDNFQPTNAKFRKPTHSIVPVISDQPQRPKSLTKLKKPNRKILSSDSESEDEFKPPETNGRLCIDYWAEVYLLQEKKWVCVDCFQNIVDMPYEIETNTSRSISYVLSFNKDSYVKDVTWRYASAWLTDVRKMRVDSEWWNETLEPFAPPDDKKDQEENKQVQAILMDKPLPSTISEFKSHPLYVLKRHLLKFEGLYPPDTPSVGFIRGEAVYARECVHTLHSREIWRKQARSVKVGEQPYKIVKARPKWDKMALKMRTDLPLEVFGEWQTEKYVPPTAKDGKVPRNEYGNVELFQPEMLPKGTVHIQLPALNRVARKLGIDCSAAVVGFEAHCYGAGPVFDGWIVCEEFKETLLLAWDEEQVNIRKKEKEKREKRIYGNWKRLIKGLLIREKIKAKYLNTEASSSSSMS